MWFMDLSTHAVWPENLRQLHMCQSLSYNPELTYSFSPLKTYFSKNQTFFFTNHSDHTNTVSSVLTFLK